MRARSRRSASDYFSAALLELSIMGIFILIAQPQLRTAIIELVQPAQAESASQSSLHALDQPVSASQMLGQTIAPALLSGQLTDSHTAGTSALGAAPSLAQRNESGWSMRTASYAPLDHFESFAVALSNDSSPARGSLQAAPLPSVEQRVARYAPSPAPTQLTVGDWNIAAAAQSPRPMTGWTSSRPADADYRDTYPPPFGTQSQWK